jgi:signal transduction histidine kinase
MSSLDGSNSVSMPPAAAEASLAAEEKSGLPSRRITPRNVIAVLAVGFALELILMVAASLIQARHSRSMEASADELVQEQLVTARLINEIQDEQGTLNAVFYELSSAKGSLDRANLITQLDETDRDIARILAAAANSPEAGVWHKLSGATGAFSTEARRLIAAGALSPVEYKELFGLHQQVIGMISQLVSAGSDRVRISKQQMARQSREAETYSVSLTAACFVLALVCAFLTLRLALDSIRRMEWQAEELGRVTWHMLEGQEVTARRMSHGLHDELGQSLTGVKANLGALTPGNLDARRADCLQLVDESIRNVRELSQLLRPVILDDFGLEAAIQWLTEGFSQRTGIRVDYQSTFHGRLADDTEIDLFRIAQEALTNVARHSAATEVTVRLAHDGERISLRVADNGRGIQEKSRERQPERERQPDQDRRGLGVVGMRARARHAGGDLTLASAPGGGLIVEARVPFTELTPDDGGPTLPANPAGKTGRA